MEKGVCSQRSVFVWTKFVKYFKSQQRRGVGWGSSPLLAGTNLPRAPNINTYVCNVSEDLISLSVSPNVCAVRFAQHADVTHVILRSWSARIVRKFGVINSSTAGRSIHSTFRFFFFVLRNKRLLNYFRIIIRCRIIQLHGRLSLLKDFWALVYIKLIGLSTFYIGF